jgi:hypothetical protein
MASQPEGFIMSYDYDEDYWYGKAGWPRLRGRIVNCAVKQAEPLFIAFRDPSASIEANVRAFVDRLVDDVGQMADQLIRAQLDDTESDVCPSSMWAFALPLFAEVESLCKAIVADVRLLRGETNRDVSPEKALGRILRSFLEIARREQSPATEHRQKTWEAIDRVSLDISRQNIGGALGDRSADEHIFAVQAALREKYPTSKNLNLSLGTLRGYFDEFCAECETRNHEELLALKDETGVWPTLDLCLDQLRTRDAGLWEALAVSTEVFDDHPAETVKQFLSRTGLNLKTFDARRTTAARLMRDCIENSISFQFQRMQRLP